MYRHAQASTARCHWCHCRNLTDWEKGTRLKYPQYLLLTKYSSYALDCLRQESNSLSSTRSVTALCVCVCCIVRVCDCIMVTREPRTQRMQHTHRRKAVTARVEAKRLLSRRRQMNYRLSLPTFSQEQLSLADSSSVVMELAGDPGLSIGRGSTPGILISSMSLGKSVESPLALICSDILNRSRCGGRAGESG